MGVYTHVNRTRKKTIDFGKRGILRFSVCNRSKPYLLSPLVPFIKNKIIPVKINKIIPEQIYKKRIIIKGNGTNCAPISSPSNNLIIQKTTKKNRGKITQ